MAAMEGVRIHVDEYSCSLCEYRAGFSSKCCCPDDPAQLLLVKEEHFRRRISLKHDQKLCSMHLKKLKRGLLFGRADWYECCAPFHIKSSQSSGLRPVPHSWKSYFESTPARNNRYRPQQRICRGCYMLAMDVISSGLDDTIDEDYEEYQSASFDLGYTSPRRWASNLSLHSPSSPFGSQAGSTWSLAHPSPHSSVTSPHSTINMGDANNSIDAQRQRARISGGKFLLPSRSLDRPSPQDISRIVPRQTSNASDLFPEPQRNLIDELGAASVGGPDGIDKSLDIKHGTITSSDSDEPTAFTSGDFVSIPQFTTPPEENQSSTEAILDNLDREREEFTDLRPENKEESSETEDSALSENEEKRQTGLGHLKPKLDCENEFNTIQNSVHHTVLETDRNPEETRNHTDEVVSDRPHSPFPDVFNGAIGSSTTTEIPNRNTESPENLDHDESITLHPPHTNSNLTSENVVQSCPDKVELSSTSDSKTDEGWEGEVHRNHDNSEGEIAGSGYVESFIPKKSCERSHQHDETREKADWSFSATFVRHDGQQDDGFENDKMVIAEGRFDPIICEFGSEVATSDEEAEASNEDQSITDEETQTKDKSSDSSAMFVYSAPIEIRDGGDSKNIRTDNREKVVLDEIASSLHQEQVHEAKNKFEGEVKPPKIETTYGPRKTLTPTLATANESSGINTQYGDEITNNSSDDAYEQTNFAEEQKVVLRQSDENTLFGQEARSQEPVKESVIEPTRVERAKHVEIGNIFEGGSDELQKPELIAGEIRETEKSVVTLLTQEAISDENDLTVGIDGQDVAAEDQAQCGTGFGVRGPPQESSSSCVTEELPMVLTSLNQSNSAAIKSNGAAEDADEELSEYQTNPDSQEFPAEKIDEQQDFVTKTNLYTKLHGSKAADEENRECSVDDGENSDETAKDDGEFKPGSVSNGVPTLRSGNRSDDGENSNETAKVDGEFKPGSVSNGVPTLRGGNRSDDGEKYDETAKVDGEFKPGSVSNGVPTLRSGNRSDDGENSDETAKFDVEFKPGSVSNGVPTLRSGNRSDDGENSDETAKVDGEFKPGSVTNKVPTLRSGNLSDDGEMPQFLRRRMPNRTGSLTAQPSDHADFCAVDGSHPTKITSDQLDAPSLIRRSVRRDKRRKLGVTFAIDPRASIVRDEPPILNEILQSDEEEQKNECSEDEKDHIDSSEVARVYRDSGENGGSENKEPRSKEAGSKEDEASSSNEDEDVSDVLSDIFRSAFTLKTISEFIQSFNTGSSVQTLVVALVTVIVILLILLAIFVFVF